MNVRSRAPALGAVLVVAAALRFWYAAGLPLSGDEVGVGVLQASGQAVTYADRLRGIVPLAEVRGFIGYDPRFSSRDVLASLREAGMHPPLYYLVIHWVLRFFGNDAATLRAVSILMSVAAVAALYALGRALAGEAAGIYAAALLAVAPYGVVYGSLVRPYPAAMLIALASTVLAVHRRIGAWVLLSIAGMYTVYQYTFVLGCQLLHLGIARRRRRDLIVLAAAATAVLVAYLPWLPSLRDHLSDVTTHPYYFHHALEGRRLATELFTLNGPLFIALPLGVALAAGVLVLAADTATRPFVLALGGYVVAYLAVEASLGMSTATEPKFLFFAMPIALLAVAVALARLPRTVAWLVVGLLLAASVAACLERERGLADSEEAYVRAFAPLLDRDRPDRLLVLNTMQRRYLFPLVHSIRPTGDVLVLPGELDLARYGEVAVVDFYVDYEPQSFLSEAELAALADTLRSRGFMPAGAAESGRHSLRVFARRSS